MKQRVIAGVAFVGLAGGLALAWQQEREQQRLREQAFAHRFEALKAEVEETRLLLDRARQQGYADETRARLAEETRQFIEGEWPEDRPWVTISLEPQRAADWAFQDSTRAAVKPPARTLPNGDIPTDLERRRLKVPTGAYIPAGPPGTYP